MKQLSKEKCRSEMEHTIRLLDSLNNRMYAYSENEEEWLDELMEPITGSNPRLWMEKNGNRQQCYSSMYSKLLLALFISEIKEAELLDGLFPKEFEKRSLDVWDDFYYDDTGEQTSAALTILLRELITQDGYFNITSDFLDLSEFDDLDGDDTEAAMIVNRIIKEIPLLDGLIKNDDIIRFDELCYFRTEFYDFEVEVETVNSSVLYEIWEMEEKEQTELGQKILALSDHIFNTYMQSDYVNDFLHWKRIERQERKIYYFTLTSSEVLGDNYLFCQVAVNRLHRYKYCYVYQIQELIQNIRRFPVMK